MKKFIFLLAGVAILTACQDNVIQPEQENIPAENPQNVQEGMQRIVASSPEEIELLIAQMGDGIQPASRAVSSATLSNNEEAFVSLVEANRQKVIASLTPIQLDSIANDEEELEFCPSDSVIADIQFAQLLNADREIQVEQTVYKYVPNGVAYTDVSHAADLRSIESVTSTIQVTPENEGQPMRVASNVDFRPIQYQLVQFEDRLVDGGGGGYTGGGSTGGNSSGGGSSNGGNTTGTSSSNGITLSNGTVIPMNDIRDINYYDKGDGNWLHRTWTGIWGRNVVAIKKFNKKKKLTMNFYDQNYIVYANIGPKLKMQKKVCGIWWNIKAQEMVQGWETVTIKYTMPQPSLPKFTNPFNNKNEYPTHAWNPFPYGKNNVLLFTIPYVNYDFTTNDLNKAFNAGLNFAWNKATGMVKGLINNDKSRAGLMAFNNKDTYVIYGPYSEGHTKKKSVETKFYAKWFPGTYEFGFSLGSSIKLVKVAFSGNDGVELYRGVVFGAIKYDGKWLAARITKNSDK